jgi:hypothetical protein
MIFFYLFSERFKMNLQQNEDGDDPDSNYQVGYFNFHD